MLCLVITPQMCRSEAELASLRSQLANPAHVEYIIEEDALVVGPEGIVARLVTECLSKKLVSETAAHFIKVHGIGSNRGSIYGPGAMMPGIRKDGTLTHTARVPDSVLNAMTERGEFTDFLGWVDASRTGSRFSDCRQTAWSLDTPEIHEAAFPFVREVSRVYREELPEHYARQLAFMRTASPDFRFDDSFSTVTVNRRKRMAYHTDRGDFAGGMGNLVVLIGNETCEIVLPRFRVAFRPRPTDVLLMNVHELHGHLPIVGDRLTAVLYAREHIDECGGEYETPDDDLLGEFFA